MLTQEVSTRYESWFWARQTCAMCLIGLANWGLLLGGYIDRILQVTQVVFVSLWVNPQLVKTSRWSPKIWSSTAPGPYGTMVISHMALKNLWLILINYTFIHVFSIQMPMSRYVSWMFRRHEYRRAEGTSKNGMLEFIRLPEIRTPQASFIWPVTMIGPPSECANVPSNTIELPNFWIQ